MTAAYPGIVDQDVDPPEGGQGFRDRGIPIRLAGDVESVEACGAANLVHQGRALFFQDVC